MSEPNSNQGNGGSGAVASDTGGGDSFSLGDFMKKAEAAPPVENPQYEPDTRSGNESQPSIFRVILK